MTDTPTLTDAVRVVRHKKRGTTYEIIGVGRAQGTMEDDDPVVLYRGQDDGGLWVRHQAEFCDGRFEDVKSAAPALPETEAVAYVPVHPRNGPLWMDAYPVDSDVSENRSNNYPVMPLYAHPPLEKTTGEDWRAPAEFLLWAYDQGTDLRDCKEPLEALRAALRQPALRQPAPPVAREQEGS